MTAYQQEPVTNEENEVNKLVLIVACLFWPISVHLAYRELVLKLLDELDY